LLRLGLTCAMWCQRAPCWTPDVTTVGLWTSYIIVYCGAASHPGMSSPLSQPQYLPFLPRDAAMLARSWESVRLSYRPSVCLSHECFVTKPNYALRIPVFWYHSSFLTPTVVGGPRPLPSEICAQNDPPLLSKNADFDRFPLACLLAERCQESSQRSSDAPTASI